MSDQALHNVLIYEENKWDMDIQTGSGAHPASYALVPGALFLGVKRPGHEADHSPPSSAEVK